MRTRKAILVVLLSIFYMVFSPVGGVAADPLPIQLDVNIGAIANIEDHPVPDDLVANLKRVLAEYVAETLHLNWYIKDGPANAKMVLKISQSAPRRKLRFKLEINGDVDKSISFRGLKPETLPVNGVAFEEDVIDAADEFLIEKEAEIQGASALVYLETNDVLKTIVQLSRPLADENRLQYRSEKLDIRWDRIARYMTFESQGADLFQIPIALRPGETRTGILKPQIYQSQLTEGDLPRSEFCFTRSMVADPSDPQPPEIDLLCPLEGHCTVHQTRPANWALDDCAPLDTQDETRALPWLWGAAYAAPLKPSSWNVPALDVLYERAEAQPGRFVGFTEFVIRAHELKNLSADSYTATLFANGVPIRLNGVSPEESKRRLDPVRGLIFRFGLENLQFAGRENGCEKLRVDFRFYEKGTPTGEILTVQRGYAALRHPPSRSSETPYGPFEWTGEYITTDARNDSAIFLASALYSVEDQAQEREALATMNQIRREIDAFGWTLRASELGLGLGLESVLEGDTELRIVGKLRPPRTVRQNGDAAYGVLVGVEEPSGQLQFTFDRHQQKVLKDFLLARRAESDAAQAIVPAEPYVYAYSKARRIGPEWVCSQ